MNQDGTFSAMDVRRFAHIGMGEGVDAASDFAVSQAGAGGMNVDVAAGMALVQGDAVSDQGLYLARETATQTVAVTTADGSNPRIDRVVLRVYDDEHDGSGFTKFTLETVDGTPTAGATLSNLNGAAALPGGCLMLAYILVGTGATSVPGANIKGAAYAAYAPGRRLLTAAGTEAYAEITTHGVGAGNKITLTDVIGDGVHKFKIEAFASSMSTTAAAGQAIWIDILDNVTVIAKNYNHVVGANYQQSCRSIAANRPAFSDFKTFHVGLNNTAGTPTIQAGTVYPAFLVATYV